MIRATAARQDGFALLIVLWTLALLSLLVAGLAAAGRSEARLAGNLRDSAELQAAADGAVHAAIFAMLRPGASRWPTSGRHLSDAPGGISVQVRTRDQAGLINPNSARPELLAALLRRLGMDEPHAANLAAAIADWRTPGRAPSPHGAKAAEYRQAGLDYGPPGAPFESLGELHDVLGMTPETLAAAGPHMTLWWEGDPEPQAADPVVALALADVGAAQADPTAERELRVVEVLARAERRGAAFTRRAVVRLGYSPDGRSWRVLAWEAGPEAGG